MTNHLRKGLHVVTNTIRKEKRENDTHKSESIKSSLGEENANDVGRVMGRSHIVKITPIQPFCATGTQRLEAGQERTSFQDE